MEQEETTQTTSTAAESFGQAALRLGFITTEQLNAAIMDQSAAQRDGLRKRIGEVLVEKGFLTLDQVGEVVKNQTMRQKKRIGDFELISKLGEGGMGAVFKARQLSMDRMVALKILSPAKARNLDARERFVREARAVARLNHPHIVTGIDTGTADGYSFFAMEYIDGESLLQYLRRKGNALDEKEVLELGRQIALGLRHAHQNGLMHRDVKPDNILLDKNRRHAKLADLGLARSSDMKERQTSVGVALGTPYYMSPEQARGQALTPATDLYSLGGTLYHLLTGVPPYSGPNAARIMARHITDPVPNPRDANPLISADTARVVTRLMQKKVEDRYADADELLKDIEKLQKGIALEPEKFKRLVSKPAHSNVQQPEARPIKARPPRRRRHAKTETSTAQSIIMLMVLLGILAIAAAFIYRTVTSPVKPGQPGVEQRK